MSLGPIGNALAAIPAGSRSSTIYVSHDFWLMSDEYRRARRQRVKEILKEGMRPYLEVRHRDDCCVPPDGDRLFRAELAQALKR